MTGRPRLQQRNFVESSIGHDARNVVVVVVVIFVTLNDRSQIYVRWECLFILGVRRNKVQSVADDKAAATASSYSYSSTTTSSSSSSSQVHARDVVGELADNPNLKRVDDFAWLAQLRYYYNDDEDNMTVC